MKSSRIILALCSLALLIGCSKDPPSLRVRNERTTKANVQFKMPAHTFNINDVEAGTTTQFQEVSEGLHEISVTIQASSDSPSGSFTSEKDFNYTVVIENTKPAKVRVDKEEK